MNITVYIKEKTGRAFCSQCLREENIDFFRQHNNSCINCGNPEIIENYTIDKIKTDESLNTIDFIYVDNKPTPAIIQTNGTWSLWYVEIKNMPKIGLHKDIINLNGVKLIGVETTFEKLYNELKVPLSVIFKNPFLINKTFKVEHENEAI